MKRIVFIMLFACFSAMAVGAFACDTNVLLEAVPNKTITLTDGSRVAPVMLNDNRHYGQNYRSTTAATNPWNCDLNCPGDTPVPAGETCALKHRELEPVWDLNYVGGTVDAEIDLLELKVTVKPTAARQKVSVSISNGSGNVRIWPASTKGIKNDLKDPFPAHTVPAKDPNNSADYVKSYYVEGINIGSAKFIAKVVSESNDADTATSELTVYVVSLVEEQDGQRRVINKNRTNIDFVVDDGTRDVSGNATGCVAFNGKYNWTVSNASVSSGVTNPTISGKTPKTSISYSDSTTSTAPAGAEWVRLPDTKNHRRYESLITVKIDNGAGNTILTLERQIRVALGEYPGTSMPIPRSTAALQTLHNWNTNPPVVFDVDPYPPEASWFDPSGYDPNDPNKDYYRLFFEPTNDGYASAASNGRAGASMRVFSVEVGILPWDEYLSTHAFDIVLDHEIRHLKQNVDIRVQKPSLVFNLDQFFKQPVPGKPGEYYAGFKDEPDGLSFSEVDASYQAEVSNLNADFRYLDSGDTLGYFLYYYFFLEDVRHRRIASANANLAEEVKTFLQNTYKGVSYLEMKRYQGMGGVPRYIVHPAMSAFEFRAPK